jgi:hypothetical protein
MRAVLVDASERVIDDRRRRGIDKLDERWAGEWHLVNPPKNWHVDLNAEMFLVLGPLAKRLGLKAYGDASGLFASEDDWRVPDQTYARPEDATEVGVTSAELLVELRSPGDETYEKIPFYAEQGVRELLVVHQDRRVELYRRRDDGQLVRVETEEGSVRSEVLGATFRTVGGPRLHIEWDGGTADL